MLISPLSVTCLITVMLDNKFLLDDRLQKIRSINEQYNLLDNGYVSFSGGKDSTVLSALIDMALPENAIPRVFINTGIEYKYIVEFVREWSAIDNRIEMIKPKKNVRQVLETFGYPFKSKEHSQYVELYQRSGDTKTVLNYTGRGDKENFLCPNILRYQFTSANKLKISDKCCKKMKKEVVAEWASENNKSITMTGMRQAEGGNRRNIQGCTIFAEGHLKKFHPLLPMEDEWIDWFVKEYDIELCKLYYPPFNFKRTGCCGCPFNTKLQEQLDILSVVMPEERKKAELIWKPVYDEYRRLGYRLDKKDSQLTLF